MITRITKMLVVAVLLTACAEPKEKTTTGAATGGLVGAGLGAIVGNQVGNTGEGLVLGALAGAGTGAAVGNAFDAQDSVMRDQDEALERQDRMISAQQGEIEELRKISQDQFSFKGDLQRELSASKLSATNSGYQNNGYQPTARQSYRWPSSPPSRPSLARVERATINQPNAFADRNVSPNTQQNNVNTLRNARLQDSRIQSNQGFGKNNRVQEKDLTPPSAQVIAKSEQVDSSNQLGAKNETMQGSYSWRNEPVSANSVPQQVPQADVIPPSVEDQSSVAKLGNDECQQASNEARSASSASETADKLFHYRRALRLCPDNADFHNGLGEVYLKLNRAEDARYEFQEALRLNPGHSGARSNLSRL